jgi:pimeloyl-ACP methyl ester carboxylesterase
MPVEPPVTLRDKTAQDTDRRRTGSPITHVCEGDPMKTVLRDPRARMPLSMGMACLVLCAAFASPIAATADEPVPAHPQVLHSDRTQLEDNIAHYRYDVAMGPGQYDVVRIHRVVREMRPNKPVNTRDAVMLLPGNPNSFEGIFMAPLVTGVSEMDHSIVMFLAQNDIDVWGMDYGWALVPMDESDFGFMGQWGLAKDVAHAEAALSFVRSLRVATGQGNGKLHLLGLSYGGQVAYPLVGEETLQPRGLRNVKGMIVLDIGVKLGNEGDSEFYCAMAEIDQALLEQDPPGSYANDIGLGFQWLAYLALTAPDETSPFPEFYPLTNWQAALFLGARTELVTGQFWHLVGGYLDEYGIPGGLRFTDDSLWVGAMGASFPPYYPRRIDVDTDQLLCGTVDTPFDDHFAQITVPILHVAAKGGFGPSAFASTALVASRDVTTITVQRLSDADEAMDFGHVDTVLATEAETLVWRPILDWIMAHRENRP